MLHSYEARRDYAAHAIRERPRCAKSCCSQLPSRRWVEGTVIASMAAIIVVDVIAPNSVLSGMLAAVAAGAHAIRLSGWQSLKTRSQPIVWVLHVAYAWLPIGLALKAAWLLAGEDWAIKWQHAFTMGALATMILAVMTRASLGHTGRLLVVPRSIALAYVLLTTGTLVRVFGAVI